MSEKKTDIIKKHLEVGKYSEQEIEKNIDIQNMMTEYALQVAREAVEEELRINLWGPSRQAVKDVLTRIESKLKDKS